MDNIAQEINETFAIVLELQFGGGNVTIRDRLEGVVIDSDGKLAVQLSHFYVDTFSLQQKLLSNYLKLITPRMKNLMH